MSDGESTRFSSPAVTPSTSSLDNGSTASAALGEATFLQRDEEEEIEFDLSDPMDLEAKMSNLTDEEIEELLKQAQKVNKELKKELHKSSGKSKSAATKTLPPLRVTTGAGSHKPSSTGRSGSLTHNPLARKSKTANGPSARRPAAKPDWNDRFGL